MKVGIMFANVGPFGTPEPLTLMARKAEEVGVESLWTIEHVVVPKGYESVYPYAKGGKLPGPEDSPIPDPLLWLAYAAAVTTKIKLATGVLILPQRHPLYVAKAVATLDQLSQGRALLGIGIGWMEEEFDALGIPFDERVARSEESIEALRSLWSDGPSKMATTHYRWRSGFTMKTSTLGIKQRNRIEIQLADLGARCEGPLAADLAAETHEPP